MQFLVLWKKRNNVWSSRSLPEPGRGYKWTFTSSAGSEDHQEASAEGACEGQTRFADN